MAGMISGYARQPILVLEDRNFSKSPWITAHDLERNGYLDVSVASEPSTELDTYSFKYQLRSDQDPTPHLNDHLILKFHKPSVDCQ